MSKGSKQRPMNVSQEKFADNWDKAFGHKDAITYRSSLHEVQYDGMWKHSCGVSMQVLYVGKGETCNYCGAWEELPSKWQEERL